MLIHGWPGGPIEFLDLIEALGEAGHDVVVPSLPGYAWSDDPGAPLNVAGVSERLRALMERGLGYERYAVRAATGGRRSRLGWRLTRPARSRRCTSTRCRCCPFRATSPSRRPPTPSARYMEAGSRWRMSEGFHLFLQSAAPDAVAVGLRRLACRAGRLAGREVSPLERLRR